MFCNCIVLQSTYDLTEEEQDKLVCIMISDDNYVSRIIFMYYLLQDENLFVANDKQKIEALIKKGANPNRKQGDVSYHFNAC